MARSCVGESSEGPWQVVVQGDQLRLMALESFVVPSPHAGGTDTEVLVGQVREGGTSELRWLVGPGDGFQEEFGLAPGADARALGAHDEGDAFAFYAGIRPTGVLRGEWDSEGRTIRWSAEPELVVPGERIDQKVTGFASCAGSAWVTVRTSLFRRIDGVLPAGQERWVSAFTDTVENEQNSGLRGITCVDHDGSEALIVGREGSGEILRFEGLPGDDPTAEVAPPVVEADIRRIVDETLRSWGHDDLPAEGPGSVGYVIPAYNELVEMGEGLHMTGVEWNYRQLACPPDRTCQPQRTFDAAACVLRRQVDAGEPVWEMACLGGDATPGGEVEDPVEQGQAFVAVRVLRPAPWDPEELWLVGYDANFVPALGTGWLAVGATVDFTGPWAAG